MHDSKFMLAWFREITKKKTVSFQMESVAKLLKVIYEITDWETRSTNLHNFKPHVGNL